MTFAVAPGVPPLAPGSALCTGTAPRASLQRPKASQSPGAAALGAQGLLAIRPCGVLKMPRCQVAPQTPWYQCTAPGHAALLIPPFFSEDLGPSASSARCPRRLRLLQPREPALLKAQPSLPLSTAAWRRRGAIRLARPGGAGWQRLGLTT